jgi:hypothetical protein
MAHYHDPEFQIRIIHDNGSEELTVWMTGEEELTRAIARISTGHYKAYWLRKRNVLCPECAEDQEQTIIVECPIATTPSARYRPKSARHTRAVGSSGN